MAEIGFPKNYTAKEADEAIAIHKMLQPELRDLAAAIQEALCAKYKETDEYKNSASSDPKNRVCCEIVGGSYCPFHKQSWFYLVLGGTFLLLVIVGIVISCCCCCKGRGGGGRDVESVESSESTETSTTKADDE